MRGKGKEEVGINSFVLPPSIALGGSLVFVVVFHST
jgi:hypothetical protein